MAREDAGGGSSFCEERFTAILGPILFLHGTQDEHGDVEKLEKLSQQVRNAETVIITGADHFFTKQLDAVEETMRSWAEEMIEGEARRPGR